MPMRKNIKISAAKRGHHERHKKNLFKSKKTLNREKQRKEANIFGKPKTAKTLRRQEQIKQVRSKKKMSAPEPVEEDDFEERLKMIASDDDGDSAGEEVKGESGSESELDEDGPRVKRQRVNVEDLERNAYQRAAEFGFEADRKVRELLPIKTKSGIVPQVTEVEEEEERAESGDEMDEDLDSDADIVEDEKAAEERKAVLEEKVQLSTADLLVERQETIESQKFRIGVICSGILEKPEEKIKNLKVLLEMVDETGKDGNVNFFSIRKLAMLSLVEVFKDIIPEYRVGVIDLETHQVKKATLQRVSYEKDLLAFYKRFLTKLEYLTAKLKVKRFSTSSAGPHDVVLAELATQCMCDVLVEHPYFNFAPNIAQLLVALLNNRSERIRETIHRAFVTVFKSDKRLDITRHIVRHLNNLIKKHKNVVYVEVVSCLLALPIKNINLDAEKQNELKQKRLEQHKSRVVNLSKRERKRKKKLAELEKELLETQAEENKVAKNSKLVDIMKLVFTIFFRTLKQAPTSKILSCTLEGLAKFAHMINIEFFSDLVEVLFRLLHDDGNLGYREQLHCIQTVFTILSGQGEVLNIDPARFYTHLYRNLLVVHAGKNHADIESILTTLENVLIKRRKHITYQRYLAFLKRLTLLSIQALHNGTLGALGIVKVAMQLSSQLDILLDTENQVGSGSYQPEVEDPEYSNANCTNLFELALLQRHYHPTVRRFAQHISSGVPTTGNGMLPPELAKLTPNELYHQFDGAEVAFNPPIPAPKKCEPKARPPGRHEFMDVDLEEICRGVLRANIAPDVNKELSCFLERNVFLAK